MSIVGPSEARPVDGLAIDFVVESDRAQLSEIVQRMRDGRLRTNIGPSRPSTMPSPPSTRPSGARGRRSFVFVREDGETATDSALLVGHHHRLDRRDQFATMVVSAGKNQRGPSGSGFKSRRPD